MNKLGYQVLCTKKRKYITYITSEGMKCRDNKLNDKKYLKEEMENAINRRFKKEEQNKYTKGTENNTNTNYSEIHVTRSRYSNRNDNLEQTSNRRYKRNKDNYEKGQTTNVEHYERIYTSRREIQGGK